MKDALHELEMARAELDEARHQNRDEDVIHHLERNVEYWRAIVEQGTPHELGD